VHLVVFPVAVIAFAIKPVIGTFSIELVAAELALVVLQELAPTMSFNQKVLIVQERTRFVLRRYPLVLRQQLGQMLLKLFPDLDVVPHCFYYFL